MPEAFQFDSLLSKVAVVSHDAGGAEILSSYVKRHSINPIYVLDGPAKTVFERKIGSIKSVPIAEALSKVTACLCGTSWQSDLEFNALKLAREAGKPSVSFLDHWVNYRERFVRKSKVHLPDQIWVGDEVAETMAKKLFPENDIFFESNPYFLDIIDELALSSNTTTDKGCISILYVCEPIKEHAKLRYDDERYWGYVEEEALRYFLTNVSVFDEEVKCIRVRPHPSEDINKYNWVLGEFSLPIVIGGKDTLLSEIMESDIVVGCESMAMIIGLLAKKRVISSIPPGGRECVLPQAAIEKLQATVDKRFLEGK